MRLSSPSAKRTQIYNSKAQKPWKITPLKKSVLKRTGFFSGLTNRGFCKKKLDARFDTHRIKTGVQLWSGWRDLNSRPLEPHSSTLPSCATPRRPICFNRAREIVYLLCYGLSIVFSPFKIFSLIFSQRLPSSGKGKARQKIFRKFCRLAMKSFERNGLYFAVSSGKILFVCDSF